MVEKVGAIEALSKNNKGCLSLVVVARVELPIIKHVPIIKQISNIFLIA
jgi:hypothetical protein